MKHPDGHVVAQGTDASGTADRRVRKVINEDGEIVLAADAASEARRSWHIAADWCEAFGPVIYAEVDARLLGARADRLTDVAHRPSVVSNQIVRRPRASGLPAGSARGRLQKPNGRAR